MRAILIGSLVVVMSAASVSPASAQLGGLMRRAKEAAEKKVVEKEPAAPEPASNTRNPFADPAVVFITQDQLARFQKALQFEIDQRNQLRKALASQKTPEEYQACATDVAMSPAMMKLIQDMADSSANATTEQIIKSQQKMQTDMAAMLAKSCGADPQQNESGRFEKLRQIEAEAGDVAMPPGWKAPAGSDTSGSGSNARPFARAYGMLKERVPVFCGKLAEKGPMTPATITIGPEKVAVVKFQGQGQEWVFRQDEAQTLTSGCGTAMALMNSLFDTEPK